MPLRSRTLLLALALTAPALAACGTDNSVRVTTTAAASPRVPAVTQARVLNGRFVAHFRAQHKALAKNSTDQSIAADAVSTCHLITAKLGTSRDASRSALLSKTAQTWTVGKVTPDTASTTRILRLVVKDACPEHATALHVVL